MNLNGLMNMVIKMVIQTAMKMGLDWATRRGKPEAEMTPEEREQAQSAKKLSDRAKEAAKLTRRLWR